MKPVQPPPRITVAERVKAEIQRASAEGVDLADLTIQLTAGEAEQLKRDRAVAVADISFTGGSMRYLGVKIQKGEPVQTSVRRRVAKAS